MEVLIECPVLISAIIEIQMYNVLLYAHPPVEERSSVMLVNATIYLFTQKNCIYYLL